MKKFILFVIVATLAAVAIQSCSSSHGKDLVEDFPPKTEHSQDFNQFLTQLQGMNAGQAIEALEGRKAGLTRKIVIFAKRQGVINLESTIDSIVYHRGSANKAEADDATGARNTGHFDNRLVAYLYTDGNEDPTKILVACMNGIFRIITGGNFERLVSDFTNFEFTIAKNEGLLHHVNDYRTAIRIANMFGLSLYEGQRMLEDREIGQDRALQLENQTDRTQVTVWVEPGDHFNLNNMTLTRRNGQVIHARN